ncbi:MAG: hypothetical protein J6U54_15560 [Clostridiales bacterium]|nr:hypothetical protein [Clostridiales bacterium]
MASLGKREFAKKDMNFFSEFTASSQAMARVLGYMIFAGIIVVSLLVILVIVEFVRWGVVKGQVKYYDNLFQTEEYRTMQDEAIELAQKSEQVNKYAYVMSQIVGTAEKETGVKMEIVDQINAHIPSYVVLYGWDIDKGTVKITGQAHNYYACTEIANMLQENKYFTNVSINVERFDVSTVGKPEDWVYCYTPAYYTFEIDASLDVQYAVSVTSLSGDKIIRAADTELVDSGAQYNIKDIGSITVAGETYNLDNVLINGVSVSEDSLNSIKAAGSAQITVTADTTVELQYVVQSSGSTTEGEAES